MSSAPLLADDDLEMDTLKGDDQFIGGEGANGHDRRKANPDSVNSGEFDGPSSSVPSRKQRLSDLFTILCAGCALISDGYANSLMTLINVVLRAQYATQYVDSVSTRVSNALLIGEICGQITIGYV